MNKLLEIINSYKKGTPRGLFSVCSSNEFVIEALFHFISKKEYPDIALIEGTSNQVNQFGGYTGLTPETFRDLVFKVAEKYNINEQRIILGGDHLGPLPWRKESREIALKYARDLVEACVKAGYRKIHLDTCYPLKGDSHFSLETIAERQAMLCAVAEEAFEKYGKDRFPPVYVLGAEVPFPGGVKTSEEKVTTVEFLGKNIETSEKYFLKFGLKEAWKRVAAFVVQSGAEFSHDKVYRYNPEKCKSLKEFLKNTPFVFEAHSTDYQTCEDLKQMVKDGFAILKVGPELTYLFREAVFALALVEKEIVEEDGQSRIVEILVEKIRRDPTYWRNYYEEGNLLDIKYSFLDRIRYYWNMEPVKIALKKLLMNLENKKLTTPLVSQYFPDLFPDILQGKITPDPLTLIFEKIGKAFEKYSKATFQI